MTTQVNDSNSAGGGSRGTPTWAVVLITLGVWVAFMRVELYMLPPVLRAARERGEAIDGLRGLLFGVCHWWCDYWWLFPFPMLFLLAGMAVARVLSADEEFRGRLARVWLLGFVLPLALLGLVSLAVCYRV
jgi:hypothetical protein